MSRYPALFTTVTLFCGFNSAVAADKQKDSVYDKRIMSPVEAGNELRYITLPGQMLRLSSVQLELEIGPRAQRDAVELADKVTKANRKAHAKLWNRKSGTAPNQILIDYEKTVDRMLRSELKPKQVKRLYQLAVQRHGLGYFRSFRARELLKLSDQQQADILKVALQSRVKSAELSRQFQNRKINRGEYFAERHQHEKKTFEKALKVLSSKQRKTYEKLAGEPFSF